MGRKASKGQLILIVILIGIVTLLFFPEPESNFLAYLGTGAFFVLVVAALAWFGRK